MGRGYALKPDAPICADTVAAMAARSTPAPTHTSYLALDDVRFRMVEAVLGRL
jgi:hypothetical protein